VIITPSDITDFVPVATAKDSDLYVTQFDNSVVETAGLLKMDFGFEKPTLIKDTVKLVKYRNGIDLDPDAFPIDDLKTYELFQRGNGGYFQYECWNAEIHEGIETNGFSRFDCHECVIPPRPIAYIPSFEKRKMKRRLFMTLRPVKNY
jgi:DNA polymerase-3 subunit alpha